MVNRVLLDTNRLKVSRPGFDVLTATFAQLSFNSDFSAAAIYARGSTSTQGNVVTIPFGKTFAARPNIDVLAKNPDLWDGFAVIGDIYSPQHSIPRSGAAIDLSYSTSALQVWSHSALSVTTWAYVIWRF
ncbi:hypothetical protein B7L88_gp021 [Rhizobium phage RHEph10]|uniref:hypothetical protein n=1 Tax=Rhizobium phage RHEph10 TaxID=1220717 RepID=UPI0002AB3EAD|nr:hypothetical protein B7L88_gp021 [Rhizobium phage RHEph10]AGC36065.1 hypothetical protein RHEph10_gp021 [Rhizobium phage RHEph10]